MPIIKILFISILLLAPAASEALLCTNLRISGISNSINLTGNPVQTLTIQVTSTFIRLGSCTFVMAFSYGGGGQAAPGRALTQGSNQWPYILSSDPGGTIILRSPTDATANTVLIGTIQGNQSSTTVTYYISLDGSNPWRRWGHYQDSYTVSLYQDVLSLLSLPMDSATVSVQYDAAKKTDLSLVDTGGSFNESDTVQTLDFGTLSAGSTLGFDLIMKYNAGVNLYLSSENSGSLKHTSASSYVPYILKLNGVTANLANASSGSRVQVFTGSGISPASGFLLPIQVIIGSTNSALAGVYNDKVILTVESAE